MRFALPFLRRNTLLSLILTSTLTAFAPAVLADDSAKPHHGCWSKIDMPHPAFHVPQFFGTITLEQD